MENEPWLQRALATATGDKPRKLQGWPFVATIGLRDKGEYSPKPQVEISIMYFIIVN